MAAYFVDCNQAMMLLLQFARDASRELALILMFAVMTDRKNLFLCHAALSERSRFNLQKRLGPLYMINRTDPGGRYWFDLTKTDDQRALRMVLQLKKTDPTANFQEVRYAEQCEMTSLDVVPNSESWKLIFAENPNAAPGTPDEILDHGILEFYLNAARKGDDLQKNLLTAAKHSPRGPTTLTTNAASTGWGPDDQKQMSKTGPAGHAPDVLTIESRPNTSVGLKS